MGLKYDDEALKRYLLGKSDAEEQAGVEQELIIDTDCFEQFMVVKDELFEDYLDEDLSPADRQAFEEYILSTPEGKQELGFARDLKKLASASQDEKLKSPDSKPAVIHFKPRSFLHSPILKIAAAIIVAFAAGTVIWLNLFYHSEIRKGFQAFSKTYQSRRPTEARLSVLAYAPTISTRGEGKETIDEELRKQAESLFRVAVSEYPGAVSYHALGLSLLADKQFGSAIEYLRKAAADSPNDARYQSDLGAALLEQGKIDKIENTGRNIQEFGESLEHLTKAIQLDSNLLDAWFNKALLTEEMGLSPAQEIEAWNDYIKRDPSSPWTQEAQDRIKAIEQLRQQNSRDIDQLRQDFLNAYNSGDDDRAWNIYRQSYGYLGSRITNGLIDSYLKEKTDGDESKAAYVIQVLTYITVLESGRAQDNYTKNLVDFYSKTSPEQIRISTEARNLVAQAFTLSGKYKNDDAIKRYQQAQQLFEQTGDEAEALLVTCRIAHCYAAKYEQQTSLSLLDPLLNRCRLSQYGWLQEQCLFVMGYVNSYLKEYEKASGYSTQALALSRKSGNVNGLLNDLAQLAELNRILKDKNDSNRFFQNSLDLISEFRVEPPQAWATYTSLGLMLDNLKLNCAALEYHKAASQIAALMENPIYLSRSHEYIALSFDKLGNVDEAVRQAQSAYDAAEKIVGERDRIGAMAHAVFQQAEIYRRNGRYDLAIKTYDKTLEMYDGLGIQSKHYDAHKGKLQALIAKGDNAASEREIQETMRLMEDYRSRITKDKHRYTFFAEEQGICNLIINFEHVKLGNVRSAFDYSEMCRARSLLDLIQNGGDLQKEPSLELDSVPVANPISLSEIQSRMPEQSEILQYEILDDRVLIFLVSKNRIVPKQYIISSADLIRKINAYVHEVSLNTGAAGDDTEALGRSSKELYDILIGPIESSLDHNKRLCIIPDQALFYLPFAALLSPKTGEYFVATQAFTIAPSSTIFILCSEKASEREAVSEEKMLSVGNPDIDRTIFKGFDDLKAAETEARSIASMYSATPLIGAKAKSSAVLAAMIDANVIHLAIHYKNDQMDPTQSRMLLSKDPTAINDKTGSSSSISAAEIYRMQFPLTRLVVLSACQTGIESYSGGEGPTSLARTFIAGGVPMVVGSLWPVDSNLSADLMISFHKHRKIGGLATAEALRQSQMDMLNSEDKRYRLPYYWASFVAIGGQTEY